MSNSMDICSNLLLVYLASTCRMCAQTHQRRKRLFALLTVSCSRKRLHMCLWAWKTSWSIVESLKVYTHSRRWCLSCTHWHLCKKYDAGMINFCIADHDKEKDPADMIDKAIDQLNLPGNSVGQSAATSQGESHVSYHTCRQIQLSQ